MSTLEEQVARLEATIAELDYHPNARAVGLSCRRTGVVGLVVPDVITPFCTSVINSVQNQLWERGYWMLLSASTTSVTQRAMARSSTI